MFCSNCGKEVQEGLNFCSFCGAPLTVAQPVQPVQPQPQYQPQYQPQPQYQSSPAPQVDPAAHSKAKTSLVFGILSMILGISFVGSLLGLIFGIVGINKARSAARLGDRSGSRSAGMALSVTGLVISIIMFCSVIFYVMTYGVVIYKDRAETAASRVTDHNRSVAEQMIDSGDF